MNTFQSLIERKLVPVGKSGNDIIYLCPKCNDSSGHLWVNYKTNKFHCFKCDFGSRSLAPLVSELGIDIKFDYDSLYSSNDKELASILSMKDAPTERRLVDYSKNLSILTEYFYFHTKPLSNNALHYLRARGLSDDLIQELKILEGTNQYKKKFNIKGKEYLGRDYSDRVLVPSLRRDGTISYYVARDYEGLKSVKYLNPPKELVLASESVYNLDNIDSEYVIICEGVFSAIAVISALNKNVAVATYGKSISSKSNSENPILQVTCQGEKLLSRNFSTYYVFYDKDAKESSLNTCEYLYDRGANVRRVSIPYDKYGEHADANDLTREELIDCIVNSEEYTGFTPVDDLLS